MIETQFTVNGNSYTFIRNPVHSKAQRESYFELARQVFGLDFSPWYEAGYWGDGFIPYTLYDNTKAVASVGISLSDMRWRGEMKRYAQISTVMTSAEYRGKGLSRRLMETVLNEWTDKCDCLYLYANDSVTDFYPRFGFETVCEHLYSQRITHKGGEVRKLDITSPDDVKLIAEKHELSNPFSVLTMENGFGLLMFHCLTFLRDNIYYIPQYDAVVIAKHEGESMFCYDIYARSGFQMGDIVGSAAKEATTSVTYGFTPKPDMGLAAKPSDEKNTTMFVLKGKENILADNEVTFPFLSRA